VLVFKNQLLGLANFPGDRKGPFCKILIFRYHPIRLVERPKNRGISTPAGLTPFRRKNLLRTKPKFRPIFGGWTQFSNLTGSKAQSPYNPHWVRAHLLFFLIFWPHHSLLHSLPQDHATRHAPSTQRRRCRYFSKQEPPCLSYPRSTPQCRPLSPSRTSRPLPRVMDNVKMEIFDFIDAPPCPFPSFTRSISSPEPGVNRLQNQV